MKLKGKVAIVTGAASGMGKAIAEAYAKEGARVVVSDVNAAGAEVVAATITTSGGEAFAVGADVALESDVKHLFEQTLERFGTLDVLVNNAGIMDGMEPVGEVSDERWEHVFAVNTTAVMRGMRLAIPIFREHGGGVIINNISVGGLYGARAGAAYIASKHAVVGLTKNTAYMYALEGIRCNGIAPGAVATNIGASMTNVSEFGLERQGLGMGTNPRVGQPEEIAALAVFLAMDEASYLNGSIITVDGGWTAY